MSIEIGERLTLNEMVEKYPDQWLFIVDSEINNETSELILGIVTAHSDLRDDVYSELRPLTSGAIIRYTGEIPEGKLCLLSCFDIGISYSKRIINTEPISSTIFSFTP